MNLPQNISKVIENVKKQAGALKRSIHNGSIQPEHKRTRTCSEYTVSSQQKSDNIKFYARNIENVSVKDVKAPCLVDTKSVVSEMPMGKRHMAKNTMHFENSNRRQNTISSLNKLQKSGSLVDPQSLFDKKIFEKEQKIAMLRKNNNEIRYPNPRKISDMTSNKKNMDIQNIDFITAGQNILESRDTHNSKTHEKMYRNKSIRGSSAIYMNYNDSHLENNT